MAIKALVLAGFMVELTYAMIAILIEMLNDSNLKALQQLIDGSTIDEVLDVEVM